MEQPLHNYMRVGLVHPPLYPAASDGPETVARSLEAIAADPFFAAVEVRHSADAGTRQRMVALLRESRLDVVYDVHPYLHAAGLDLCSVDESRRRQALSAAKGAIDTAVEAGAEFVILSSGPDPGLDGRDGASDALVDSLYDLADHTADHGDLALSLRPLPRGGPDGALIGPTSEAVSLVRLVREIYPAVNLTLDTGHLASLGEDAAASFALAASHLGGVSLAVMAPSAPADARNDVAWLNEMLLALFRVGFLGSGRRPLILLRAAPRAGESPDDVIAAVKGALNEAWARL